MNIISLQRTPDIRFYRQYLGYCQLLIAVCLILLSDKLSAQSRSGVADSVQKQTGYLLSDHSITQPDRLVLAGVGFWQYTGSYERSIPGPSIHLAIRTNKKRYFNSRIEVGYARISGFSDVFAQNLQQNGTGPTSSFQTDIIYGSLELVLNLIKRSRFSVSLQAGLGLARFIPQDAAGTNLVNQNNTRAQAENYAQTTVLVPVGIGGHYWLTPTFGLACFCGLQNPSSQYLDNVNRLGTRQDQVVATRFSLMWGL